jgi:cytochrome c peroxidase
MLRNKYVPVLLIMIATIAVALMAFNQQGPDKNRAVMAIGKLYLQDIRRFDSLLEEYPRYYYDSSYTMRRRKFEELAYQFKRVEALFVYFHPKLAYETFLKTAQLESRDFGPPFPDNWLWLGPFGIEVDSVATKMAADDKVFAGKFIGRSVTNFRKLLKETDLAADVESMTEADVFEALRLQMVRMSTVGLANGDFVITEAGIPSLKGEFSSWSEMMKLIAEQLPAGERALRSSIFKKTEEGKRMLDNSQDFNSFNRMLFLTDVLIPLSRNFKQAAIVLKVKPKYLLAALQPGAANVYEMDVFNANFFAPGEEAHFSEAKAELGKLLFFDPLLSGNNQRSCASCHKPELAFTDGNRRSMNFERGDLPRNAPTVINAAFQKAQFWDLRSNSLEDQLDSVINSTDEMHSSFDDVIKRLNASEEYKQLFYAAFPECKTSDIQRKHVKIAIASYERTLTGLNSRFDQYVRGDKKKLTPSEVNGFNVYMGKAKCGACHYAPLFAGALPPYFEITDHRSIGVPLQDSMKVYQVDIDTGASKVFESTFTHFSFKVPTIRNVELTAPYMHNGVFRTLEQVVDFYEDAGGVKFTKDMRPGMKGLPFFMILPEKLNLTAQEKADLVAFMKALTDNSAGKNIPTRLPEVSGVYANWNKRVVGGVY